MGVSIGTADITCAYVGSSPLSAIYVWDTKVRPTIVEAYIDFLLIWGWGWGGNYWGWGGAGWVIQCSNYLICTWSYNVEIGEGWISCVSWDGVWHNGWNSLFDSNIAYWGWGGAGSTVWANWRSWGSWGGGAMGSRTKNPWAWGSGCAWQWNNGGSWHKCSGTWGGGWAWAAGGNAPCRKPWNWGNGIQSDISGEMLWYAWGGGWLDQYTWNCIGVGGCGWGWNGLFYACSAAQKNATNASYYWGGGGATIDSYNTGNCYSRGCQWIFIARYPASCWYNITWGTKYECNWYCIHCFTSNGTLTVW